MLIVLAYMISGVSNAGDQSNLKSFWDLITRKSIGYRVDSNAEFIGKGLVVDSANQDHSWLLSDWDSIAQQVARTHEWASDSDKATYLRSYQIDHQENFGFVWQWHHRDKEVLLIQDVAGRAGWDITVLLNTHSITVDEAILASYYTRIRQSYDPFKVKKWELGWVEPEMLPDALDHIGDEFFSRSEYFKPFDGQIISLRYEELSFKDGSLFVESQFHGNAFELPLEFYGFLSQRVKQILDAKTQPLICDLKIQLDADGTIERVIAGSIYIENEDESMTTLWQQPVPKGILGEGSLPSYGFE